MICILSLACPINSGMPRVPRQMASQKQRPRSRHWPGAGLLRREESRPGEFGLPATDEEASCQLLPYLIRTPANWSAPPMITSRPNCRTVGKRPVATPGPKRRTKNPGSDAVPLVSDHLHESGSNRRPRRPSNSRIGATGLVRWPGAAIEGQGKSQAPLGGGGLPPRVLTKTLLRSLSDRDRRRISQPVAQGCPWAGSPRRWASRPAASASATKASSSTSRSATSAPPTLWRRSGRSRAEWHWAHL